MRWVDEYARSIEKQSKQPRSALELTRLILDAMNSKSKVEFITITSQAFFPIMGTTEDSSSLMKESLESLKLLADQLQDILYLRVCFPYKTEF